MADPMQTLLDDDKGPDFVAKGNENFRRRFTPDVRSALDAAATQLATDELLRVSATTAARTLALLPAATANAFYLVVTAADVTNTYTIDPNGSEQVDGASTKVITSAKKLLLVPDGSVWISFDMT